MTREQKSLNLQNCAEVLITCNLKEFGRLSVIGLTCVVFALLCYLSSGQHAISCHTPHMNPKTSIYATLFPLAFFLGVSLMFKLGGREVFNFSAFSLSFRMRVYRWRWHRTLNLICADFLLRFIRTDEASLRREISRKFLMSKISRGMMKSGIWQSDYLSRRDRDYFRVLR